MVTLFSGAWAKTGAMGLNPAAKPALAVALIKCRRVSFMLILPVGIGKSSEDSGSLRALLSIHNQMSRR